jgi:predicted transcriptional regulator
MTKHSLELLIERIASWPDEAQEEFVRSLADIERRHAGVYRLNEEERAAVRRGLADLKAGRLASDEAVAAVFNRYGA